MARNIKKEYEDLEMEIENVKQKIDELKELIVNILSGEEEEKNQNEEQEEVEESGNEETEEVQESATVEKETLATNKDEEKADVLPEQKKEPVPQEDEEAPNLEVSKSSSNVSVVDTPKAVSENTEVVKGKTVRDVIKGILEGKITAKEALEMINK